MPHARLLNERACGIEKLQTLWGSVTATAVAATASLASAG